MAYICLAVRGVRLRLFGSVTAPSSPDSPVEPDEPSPRFASSHTASSRSTRFHSCGRSPPCSTESVLWELETSEDAECSLVASLPLLASPCLSVMNLLIGYSLRRVFARVVGAEHHDSCGADVVAPVPCWLRGRLVCSGHSVSHESDQRLTLTAVGVPRSCGATSASRTSGAKLAYRPRHNTLTEPPPMSCRCARPQSFDRSRYRPCLG